MNTNDALKTSITATPTAAATAIEPNEKYRSEILSGSHQDKHSSQHIRARTQPDGSVLPTSRHFGHHGKHMDWDAVRGVWVPTQCNFNKDILLVSNTQTMNTSTAANIVQKEPTRTSITSTSKSNAATKKEVIDFHVEEVPRYVPTGRALKIYGKSLVDIAALPLVRHLSPTLQGIAKNIELIRVIIKPFSSSSPSSPSSPSSSSSLSKSKYRERNGTKKCLWPGGLVGGAAIQCKFCKGCKRVLLHSFLDIQNHMIELGLNHVIFCKKSTPMIKSHAHTLIASLRVEVIAMKRLRCELGIFNQHLIARMQKKLIYDNIPMIYIKKPIIQKSRWERKKNKSKAFYVEEVPRYAPFRRVIGPGKEPKAFDVQEISPW